MSSRSSGSTVVATRRSTTTPGLHTKPAPKRTPSKKSQVASDAAIAQALAKAEQEALDARLARVLNGMGSALQSTASRKTGGKDCPGQHGLKEFRCPAAQRVECDECGKRLAKLEKAWGCTTCNYDVCESCRNNPKPASSPRLTVRHSPTASTNAANAARRTSAASASSPSSTTSTRRTSTPSSSPLVHLRPPPPPTHMCNVPCVMAANTGKEGAERCVEMMVDTGAQSSVISMQLARSLGLESRLDRSHRGVAAGVGRAAIVGKLRNVVCQLGQVEFLMDFTVLEVQDELLLLGMDLMRKYKCVVDLEKDVLLFGGRNGVEVSFMPPTAAQVARANQVRG